MLGVLNETEWTHSTNGTIYQNSFGAYWVLNDSDNTVAPLVWGRLYNNVKARHISEAEIDTFLKRPQSHFQINL